MLPPRSLARSLGWLVVVAQAPAGVVHMHRTRAGVIPYNNLQFGRLQNLRLFRLDGRRESDFAVRIPPHFRDSLEMIYGDGGVGPTKKRMFHLHYEFYDPSEPGSSSASSPSTHHHRWPKRSNSDKLKHFMDGGSVSAPVAAISAAAIRKQQSAHALDESVLARPSILHSMSAPSSTRHTPAGVAATAGAGTVRGYKRDGKDIDVIVIYREIAHPNTVSVWLLFLVLRRRTGVCPAFVHARCVLLCLGICCVNVFARYNIHGLLGTEKGCRCGGYDVEEGILRD